MRQQQGVNNMRRPRRGPSSNNGGSNNRRPQNQGHAIPNRNQTLDSNGPDVHVRGTASQIHDKYLNLARDANATGNYIAAENYLQHAEHYFRIMAAQNEQQAEQRARHQPRPEADPSQAEQPGLDLGLHVVESFVEKDSDLTPNGLPVSLLSA